MKKQLEIATIKANNSIFQGCELYWLLSRNQLEFLFREVEIISSPPFAAAVQYQETMLPVINLEKYYGLEKKDKSSASRYLVIRSVNERKELVKVIVETPHTLNIQRLDSDFKSMQSLTLPQNSEDVLGIYSLAAGKVGIVPDFAGMSQSLEWRGNKN